MESTPDADAVTDPDLAADPDAVTDPDLAADPDAADAALDGVQSLSDADPDGAVQPLPDGDAVDGIQPLRDEDATAPADPSADPAQAEWERTEALDDGATGEAVEPSTATGRDPAEIPDDADEIPAADLPAPELQPESQGEDPVIADLGEDGEGDLSPSDV